MQSTENNRNVRPDIEAIAERADAATPAPWLGWRDNNGNGTEILIAYKEPGPLGRELSEAALCHVCAVDGANTDTGLVLDWGSGVNRANAEFIAHAREDVPTLIAALAAERDRADRAEADLENANITIRVLTGGKA